jgi:LysM repeat protein
MNSSRVFTFVLLVAAIAGIILGGAALSTSVNNKKDVAEVKAAMATESAGAAELKDEIRMLAGRSQDGMEEMNRRVLAMRVELTNLVARQSAPPPPKVEAKKEEAAVKKDQKAPVAAVPAGPGVYHTIATGDTFGRVAKQYGTKTDALEKLNPGVNASHLKLGQKIRVK